MNIFRMIIEAYGWFLIGTVGLMWLTGFVFIIYAHIKTRTLPWELNIDELVERIFKSWVASSKEERGNNEA